MNAYERKLTAQYKALIESPELSQKAADVLLECFPKQEKEPVYSVGFQRWQKLTKKQRNALHVKFNFDPNAIKNALQNNTAAELLK